MRTSRPPPPVSNGQWPAEAIFSSAPSQVQKHGWAVTNMSPVEIGKQRPVQPREKFSGSGGPVPVGTEDKPRNTAANIAAGTPFPMTSAIANNSPTSGISNTS